MFQKLFSDTRIFPYPGNEVELFHVFSIVIEGEVAQDGCKILGSFIFVSLLISTLSRSIEAKKNEPNIKPS